MILPTHRAVPVALLLNDLERIRRECDNVATLLACLGSVNVLETGYALGRVDDVHRFVKSMDEVANLLETVTEDPDTVYPVPRPVMPSDDRKTVAIDAVERVWIRWDLDRLDGWSVFEILGMEACREVEHVVTEQGLCFLRVPSEEDLEEIRETVGEIRLIRGDAVALRIECREHDGGNRRGAVA